DAGNLYRKSVRPDDGISRPVLAQSGSGRAHAGGHADMVAAENTASAPFASGGTRQPGGVDADATGYFDRHHRLPFSLCAGRWHGGKWHSAHSAEPELALAATRPARTAF